MAELEVDETIQEHLQEDEYTDESDDDLTETMKSWRRSWKVYLEKKVVMSYEYKVNAVLCVNIMPVF